MYRETLFLVPAQAAPHLVAALGLSDAELFLDTALGEPGIPSVVLGTGDPGRGPNGQQAWYPADEYDPASVAAWTRRMSAPRVTDVEAIRRQAARDMAEEARKRENDRIAREAHEREVIAESARKNDPRTQVQELAKKVAALEEERQQEQRRQAAELQRKVAELEAEKGKDTPAS
jgi:hypothetical protein